MERSRDMNVMILAAGRGRRLDPITNDLPKALVDVGGKTILERQVESLTRAGIDPSRITVVGGHAYDQLLRRAPESARIIRNRRYLRWDNIYSITLGEPAIAPTLLINGDGLYHPDLFARTVLHAAPNFLVVDTGRQLGHEEMKVRYEEGRLRAIRKGMPVEDAHGEYVGIARFDRPTWRRIREVARKMIAEGFWDCWYESAIERVAAERAITMLDTNGLPWVEIDDPDDLERANALASNRPGFLIDANAVSS